MKGGVIAVIAILAVFQLAVQHGHAVTCGEVDVSLMPCINYLIGHDSSPSPACCAGVKAVKGMACCGCVKAAANRYTDLKDEAAQSLPTKCAVQLDIPISRTVDCTKIN
ncbi:hypothetical protein MIMGU_mgv1a016768mg [Erythranthe guttata]|uniref:Non-specific lipid-transfer protein n=1 Tax=Erythranthe guttata TaxID=4155 RepID=A0A022RPE1_ERYGU|nr:PREDICTED: non-specific lipid-transfer protein A-like [Erythranthe guttata]EYU42347.1 hypothetical protein MIMGU_mgv1a016768mg [Erythranthe guttata]|eukprot:XP_012831478.1 PREDICTED: non-specific lipid-transfer protein A-like [Erythranthe guttata]